MVNLNAVDSVIKRGIELLDIALAAGRITINAEKWKPPPALEDRVDLRQFGLVLLGLCVKSQRSLLAVRGLAKSDLGSDASVIGRTMVETYASVLELTGTDWAEKSDSYRTHMAKKEQTHIRDLEGNPHAGFDGPGIETVEQYLSDAEEFYGAERVKQIGKDWMGGGVQAALRGRRLESLYDSAYRVGAKASHALDPLEFADWTEEEGFVIKTESRWTVPTLLVAGAVYLDILAIVGDVLGLDVLAEVGALQEELHAATRFVPPKFEAG